ncbi:TolC family protein [Vicingaceae bacterium]|nr:TolC family protein [Vicingaceae bacterium]
MPNLKNLIDSAYINSPVILSQKVVIEQRNLETDIEKNLWLKLISVNSNYSRGTNNVQIEGALTPTFSSTVTNWYGAGASIKIPISTIVNRKKQISIAKLQKSIEENKLAELKKSLKTLIINLYMDVLLKEKIMSFKNESIVMANLNYKYAEISYKNNTLEIEMYTKAFEANINAKINFEIAKTNYIVALSLLEGNVGIKLK